MNEKCCRKGHKYSSDFKQCPECKTAYRATDDFKARIAKYNKRFQSTLIYKQKNSEYHRRLNNNPTYREKRNLYFKLYNKNNKQKRRVYEESRKKTDPLYRLTCKLRCLLSKSITKKGYSKRSKTFQLLRASAEQVQSHLIKTAIKNYGEYSLNKKYHIDHIIPCTQAKTEEELLKLQYFTNLQLLKPEDNIAKSNKLDWKLPDFS